ncbi:MAG TPA: hypothetical protein VGB37_08565 [Candidatus Lokiarchaeia archaeon]
MKFIHILKTLQNKQKPQTFAKDSIYIVSNGYADLMRGKNTMEVLDEIITPLDIEDNNYKSVLIICGGGIGDIIALSSICYYLKDKIIYFATQSAYFCVLELFLKKAIPVDINGAILKDYTLTNRLGKYTQWRRVKCEFAVVNNNHLDWYDVLFSIIGVRQIETDYLGPKINQERLNGNPSNILGKSLLICNKASCMMRSIHFMDIYRNLTNEIKNTWQIYAYENNLSEEDKMNIPKEVKIIKTQTLTDFFNDLYDATDVITIDSVSLHYREGIGKSAIGLFNSFDKDSRTKFYKYTKSFNIKSECDLQPCFKHELNPGDLCLKVKSWQFSAPCFQPKKNKYLNGQLREIFKHLLTTD